MSELKLCQGPECHIHQTKDRLKGPKDNKTFQTRRRSNLLYDEFCSTWCESQWFNKFGTRAVDHFGRLTEPKHLTEDNAWSKSYDYNGYRNLPDEHYFLNGITKERRPITQEQYDDDNYTLNIS